MPLGDYDDVRGPERTRVMEGEDVLVVKDDVHVLGVRDGDVTAIRLTPGLFVCGIAINMRDMLDLFDQVFLLSIDAATQIERLASAGDRDPSLWQPIIDGRPVFEDEMQAVGATVLDGRMTTSDLASLIVQALRP